MAVKQHLLEKRDQLIWALSLQDYSFADLCEIFNIKHRTTVMRIVAQKPVGWIPPWIKRIDML